MGAALSRVRRKKQKKQPDADLPRPGEERVQLCLVRPTRDAEWGMTLVDDHEGVVQQYGGVPVCGIVPSSAAEGAGVTVGDVIHTVSGRTITSLHDFKESMVNAILAGTLTLELTVHRPSAGYTNHYQREEAARREAEELALALAASEAESQGRPATAIVPAARMAVETGPPLLAGLRSPWPRPWSSSAPRPTISRELATTPAGRGATRLPAAGACAGRRPHAPPHADGLARAPERLAHALEAGGRQAGGRREAGGRQAGGRREGRGRPRPPGPDASVYATAAAALCALKATPRPVAPAQAAAEEAELARALAASAREASQPRRAAPAELRQQEEEQAPPQALAASSASARSPRGSAQEQEAEQLRLALERSEREATAAPPPRAPHAEPFAAPRAPTPASRAPPPSAPPAAARAAPRTPAAAVPLAAPSYHELGEEGSDEPRFLASVQLVCDGGGGGGSAAPAGGGGADLLGLTPRASGARDVPAHWNDY